MSDTSKSVPRLTKFLGRLLFTGGVLLRDLAAEPRAGIALGAICGFVARYTHTGGP